MARKAKHLPPRTLVEKLTKTRKSIAAHRARGQGLGENGNINIRGCDLVDRYNDLATKLRDKDWPGWVAYCEANGSSTQHNGHDLFA